MSKIYTACSWKTSHLFSTKHKMNFPCRRQPIVCCTWEYAGVCFSVKEVGICRIMGLQQDCRQDLNVLARLADSNSSACLHSGRSKELVSRADWRLFWKARHNGTASAELSLAYFLRNVLDFKQRRSKLKFAIIPVGWGRGGGGEWGFRAMLWHRAATAQERNERLKSTLLLTTAA
jgi:hypothetical protein